MLAVRINIGFRFALHQISNACADMKNLTSFPNFHLGTRVEKKLRFDPAYEKEFGV